MPEDKDCRQNQVGILNKRERLGADRHETIRGADCLHVFGKAARNKDDETDAGNLLINQRLMPEILNNTNDSCMNL